MDCGASDYACQIYEWAKENEFAAAVLAKIIARTGADANGIFGWLASFVREHGDKLIAAAVFSFGLYKWWVYRERILHQRLAEYLQESDSRLKGGLKEVLDALARPSPGQIPEAPLFASDELRVVLRERNWDREAVALTVSSSATLQLQSAMEKINRQLKTGEDAIASLRLQLASAHIIQGAIASATAQRLPDENGANISALQSFRLALQIPGHDQSVLAKELEAHQLRKLGRLHDAYRAYREVERLARSYGDYQTQRLTIARAKRYQAEIFQAQKCTVNTDGAVTFRGSKKAFDLLDPEKPDSALNIRANFAPYQAWDLLEQADIHHFMAFVAHNYGAVRIEREQWQEAQTAYQTVISKSKGRWIIDWRTRRLRNIAASNLRRLKSVNDLGYDARWLLPQVKPSAAPSQRHRLQ